MSTPPLTDVIDGCLLVKISAFKELVPIWPSLPAYVVIAPNLQMLEISTEIPGAELESSKDLFKLSDSFSHLSLIGVPLGPFIRQHKTLTEFTYVGTFAQHIDRLLDFLDWNPQIVRVNLTMKFKSRELRQQCRRPPDHGLLQVLNIRSGELEDVKALISNINLKRTNDASIKIIGDSNVAGTIISFTNYKYFKDKSPPTSMTYVHGIGVKLCGIRQNARGPNIFFNVDPGLSIFPPLSFEYVQDTLGFSPSYFKNIENLTLSMCCYKGVFNQYLFPALECLIVSKDSNPSKTLSRLFSSSGPKHSHHCLYRLPWLQNIRGEG